MNNEVSYCGKCRRQQTTNSGATCIICKSLLVTWKTNIEKESDVLQKWKLTNSSS